VSRKYVSKVCALRTFEIGATIGAAYDLSIDQIDAINNQTQTWAWDGCINLDAGQILCLSLGLPPMPAPIQNATCGPQVPGTPIPANMSELANLNPCPLNACCDVWGQCGTTDEFCTPTNSTTGNPATAAKGTNGCFSNCGTDIVNNNSTPPSRRTVGYFEGFNTQRPCLTMDASQINSSVYDTVHFAFGAINPDFSVNMSGVQQQWDVFMQQTGFNKVHRHTRLACLLLT
jgi:chitinase